MIYHGLNDKRLKTVTFPFEDGSHPTYYIPAEASDLINNSTASGATVKDALDTIDSEVLATLTQRSAKPGSIVTFEDGADDIPLRHLELDITPVQDLHGQENPYPAGGGRNMWDGETNSTSSNSGITATFNNDGSVTVTGTASAVANITLALNTNFVKAGDYIFSIAETEIQGLKIIFGGNGTSGFPYKEVTTNSGVITATSDGTVGYHLIRVAEGTTVNATIYPMLRLSTETDATFAPYSNICPITGYTGAEVSVTGKNIWDEEWELGGLVWATGLPASVNDKIRSKNYCTCLPNTTYFAKSPNGLLYAFWYDKDYSFISYEVSTNQNLITSPSNACFFKIVNGSTTTVDHDIYINYPATDTEYHAYTGNTYSISFPSEAGTVYSGHVDVNKDGTGILVVDKANVDLGTLSWTLISDSAWNCFSTSITDKKSGIDNILSSVYPFGIVYGTQIDKIVCGNSSNSNVYIRDFSYSDATAFKTAMSGVQLVYELATPITYALDPVQVKSLLGLNNVWTDTGDITDLTYYVGGQYKDAEDKRDIIEATIPYDTASGAIATFPDGADNVRLKQLSVGINPVQDLHGYDNPWPAGGGKNLLEVTGTTQTIYGVTFTVNSDGTISVSGTASSSITFIVHEYQNLSDYGIESGTTYILSGTPSGLNGNSYIMLGVYGSGSEWRDTTGDGASFTLSDVTKQYRVIILVASGATINAVFKPMICLASASNPTTFAPYSNICPISGHTSANVMRTGVNVWDEEWESGTLSTVTGEPIANAGQIRAKNYISVVGGETYSMVTTTTPDGVWMLFYDSDKNVIADELPYLGGKASNARKAYKNVSIPMPQNCSYVRFYFQQVYGTTYNNDTGINYPSTDTSYHPYQGATYPITFPSGTGTVYGGNVTVNRDGSGKLVVDRANVDLSTITVGWADYAGIHGYTMYLASMIAKKQFAVISSHFKTIASADANAIAIATNNSGYIYFCNVTQYGNTIANFRQWLSENNVEFVIELANPTSISLTAPQITTLLGTNNIWSDTNGDVSVNYPCDVGLYITKKLEELVGGNG